MLYDPKWEQPTKVDPFSLESLIAWLEQQPARQGYRYDDPANCVFAQFAKAQSWRCWFVFPRMRRSQKLFHRWPDIALGQYGDRTYGIYTFGAALERARAIAR